MKNRYSVRVQTPQYGNYVFIWDSEKRVAVKTFPYKDKDANSQKIALVKAYKHLDNMEGGYDVS